jgi:hypothetical protein
MEEKSPKRARCLRANCKPTEVGQLVSACGESSLSIAFAQRICLNA